MGSCDVQEQREQILNQRPDVAQSWDIEYGDRNTQFVIIGTELDQEKIVKRIRPVLSQW